MVEKKGTDRDDSGEYRLSKVNGDQSLGLRRDTELAKRLYIGLIQQYSEQILLSLPEKGMREKKEKLHLGLSLVSSGRPKATIGKRLLQDVNNLDGEN